MCVSNHVCNNHFCCLSLPQLDGELVYAPGFPQPPNSDYEAYHTYIDENLPPESPYLYGLHPNAEIGFLTTTSESLFRTVLEMQPRDSSAAGAGATSREEKVNEADTWQIYNQDSLKSGYLSTMVSRAECTVLLMFAGEGYSG